MPRRTGSARSRPRERSRSGGGRAPRSPAPRPGAARTPERGDRERRGTPRPRFARLARSARPAKPIRQRLGISAGQVERILGRQPWSMLEGPLRDAGVDAATALARLREFARLVIEWNASASNLISRNDEERIVARHLFESIAPCRQLVESGCRRWIDFGSGAGFPAIPLALAGVPGQWTLVESRRTKTLFIRKSLQQLEIQDFIVENARLEELATTPRFAAAFDGFISRATMRLGPTLSMAAHVVEAGGSAFLWKGSGLDQEMGADPSWGRDWVPAERATIATGPVVVARFIKKATE